MLRSVPKKHFGLIQGFKKIWSVPKSHLESMVTAKGGNNNMLQNATTLFDDMASEWQSVFVENTYELSTFQSFDAVSQGNFGTVDNPHLIFTSDIPFRFVGCTGPPNEDDYEGHELIFFLLREGPLQRCQSCGQVFKLVRLRDEFSTENDYYQSQFFKQDYNELGDADHWIQNSVLRLMPHSYEHSLFEVHSNPVFSLKNPDDHDRVLTDPAYRLEQLKLAEEKTKVYLNTLEAIERSIIDYYGNDPASYSKEVYENVVNAQIALNEFDRHFKNVQRFNIRAMLDPANHERREARMLERAKERTQDMHTVYLNDVTENELRFRDYFESDSELLDNLKTNVYQQKAEILQSGSMKMDNYDFQEVYSQNAEPDSSSYINRKVFRFNYRQAFVKPQDHIRKETRMIEKFKASGIHQKIDEMNQRLIQNPNLTEQQRINIETEYHEALIDQAIENYKNYFESDLEEDFEYFNGLPSEEKREFLTTYSKNGFTLGSSQSMVSHIMLPKEHDPDHGFFKTASELWADIENNVVPHYNRINNQNLNQATLDHLNNQINKN